MVSEGTAVGRSSRASGGVVSAGEKGAGEGGEGETARRKMRAREARKGEMDSLYFGGRHAFLDIHNCTLSGSTGDPRD